VSNPTAGDLILVDVTVGTTPTLPTFTIADTQSGGGNVYTSVGRSVQTSTTPHVVTETFACTNCKGGSANTVTVTASGLVTMAIAVTEYAGTKTLTFDSKWIRSGVAVVFPNMMGAPVSVPCELVHAAIGSATANPTAAPPGFTERYNSGTGTGTALEVADVLSAGCQLYPNWATVAATFAAVCTSFRQSP
jgi:hypothetical protein